MCESLLFRVCWDILFLMTHNKKYLWKRIPSKNTSVSICLLLGVLVVLEALFPVLPSSAQIDQPDSCPSTLLGANSISESCAAVLELPRLRQKTVPAVCQTSWLPDIKYSDDMEHGFHHFVHTRYSRACHVIHKQLLI